MVGSGSEVDGALIELESKIAKETGYRNIRLIMNNINRIAQEMPDTTASVEKNRAFELAATFLKGAEMCGELCSIAGAYEASALRNKKMARSKAILITAKNMGLSTVKEKEVYADMDPEFLDADLEAQHASMFKELVENKREDLIRAHFLMRKLAEDEINTDEKKPGSKEDYGF